MPTHAPHVQIFDLHEEGHDESHSESSADLENAFSFEEDVIAQLLKYYQEWDWDDTPIPIEQEGWQEYHHVAKDGTCTRCFGNPATGAFFFDRPQKQGEWIAYTHESVGEWWYNPALNLFFITRKTKSVRPGDADGTDDNAAADHQ